MCYMQSTLHCRMAVVFTYRRFHGSGSHSNTCQVFRSRRILRSVLIMPYTQQRLWTNWSYKILFEWRRRIAARKLEKEKVKLDAWKLKHLEQIWSEQYLTKLSKTTSASDDGINNLIIIVFIDYIIDSIAVNDRSSLKTTVKFKPTSSIANSTTTFTSHNYTTRQVIIQR